MPPNRRSHRTPRYSRQSRSAALRITPRRVDPETRPPASESEEPRQSTPTAADPLDTVSATSPEELSDAPASADTTSAGHGEEDPAEETSFLPLESSDDGDEEATEPFELEDYVRQIEAAAARDRAKRRPVAAAAARAGQDDAQGRPAKANGGRTRVATDGTRQRPRVEPKKKPFFKRRKTWFIIAALLPIIAGIVALAYILNVVWLGYDAYNQIHQDPVEDRVRWRVNAEGTPEPLPTEAAAAILPDWDNDEPVNIVLLGVDTRIGDDQPPRSDTTIVVHIEPATDEVTMMSIPRDLMVFIPGFGDDKFNAAYPLGEVNADEIPGGGPSLVAQTIEANFNIPIHYFATVDFEGFRKIVNTVGGVVVDAQVPLSDNLYPTDDLRLTRVYFPAGLQKLDGNTALEYVRTRHADSDLGRANRQQEVLMAIREQAIGLELITRAPDLIQDLGDTVRTDLNFNQMLALANLGRNVQTEDIVRFDLWQLGMLSEHYPETEGDAYYLEADWQAVHQAQVEYFGIEPDLAADPAGEESAGNPDLDTPIFVENGTDVEMLAGNTAQILAEAGFTAVWPTDATEPAERTVIRNFTGNESTARFVAETLGLPETAIEQADGGDGITVVLGNDIPPSLHPNQDSAIEE